MSMSENKAAQFQLHGSRLTSTFATPRLPLEPIPPTPSFFFLFFFLQQNQSAPFSVCSAAIKFYTLHSNLQEKIRIPS